jgi:hypothetical protein
MELYEANKLVFNASPTKGSLISMDDAYNGCIVHITSGFGERELAEVIDYVAATRTCALRTKWNIVPDSAGIYEIRPHPIPVRYDTVIAWRAVRDFRLIRYQDRDAIAAAERAYVGLKGSTDAHLISANSESGPRRVPERGGMNEFDPYDAFPG